MVGAMRFPTLAGLAWLAWVGLGLPVTALGDGPSFDCDRASRPIEHLICADPKLATQDQVMATLYAAARTAGSETEARRILNEQRTWLRERNRACALSERALNQAEPRQTAIECLRTRYARRIQALRAQVDRPLRLVGQPEVKGQGAVPQVCLTFDARLDTSGSIPLADFVATVPEADLVARVDGHRLCLEGWSHGTRYRVGLRSGLPGIGATLPARRDLTVTLPDRAPQLRFATTGHILPIEGSAGLPIETVNHEAVRVVLLRITDQDLLETLGRRPARASASFYRLGRLLTRQGKVVWQGTVPIEGPANRVITTALPITTMLPERRPGAYLAALRSDPATGGDLNAFHWFVVSDVGLTAYEGADGLTVQARSVTKATPQTGIRLELRAADNRVLTTASTGTDGLATLDPGYLRGRNERRPALLYAYGPAGDFVYLELERSGLDLTDRGVGGRPAPGPLDAFLTPERGVYRPGGTVHLTALLRDDRARAVTDLPLTLAVTRSDGVEVLRRRLRSVGQGGYETRVDLAPNAATGRWRVAAHIAGQSAAVGATDFLVEDFVPPRIAVDLAADPSVASPNGPVDVTVTADFLYGAPAADLAGELAVLLQPDRTPPAPASGYHFGLAQDPAPAPVQLTPQTFRTGPDGRHTVALRLRGVPDTSHPLEAELRASVFDVGGRPLSQTVTLPVANQPVRIGIRPGFVGERVATDHPVTFDVLALQPSGEPLAGRELTWRVVREHVDYLWYRAHGRWSHETVHSDRGTVAAGRLTTPDAGAAPITATIADWGAHRLEVTDAATGTASSLRFRSGWGQADPSAAEGAPDRVAVQVAPGPKQPGETAEVRIEPPFPAQVQVVVADRRVHSTRNLTIGPEGGTVTVPLPEEAGAGVYVLTHAVAAPDGVHTQAPARAVGVAWIPYAREAGTIRLALGTPERVSPDQPLRVRLTGHGLGAEDPAFVQLAAVDAGVLQLTGFEPPDPLGHYYGQRRLGISLRDSYGAFIDAAGASRGRVRSGGDSAAALPSGQLSRLPTKTREVVARVSGIQSLPPAGDNGTRSITLPVDLPDFDGRLRLMALAWSAERLGAADAPVTVRRPLIADLRLPRFLAPGDTAEATIDLHNLDRPAGTYRAVLTTDGPVRIAGANILERDLTPGERHSTPIRLEATGPGEATLRLTVTGPTGKRLKRAWPLSVRSGNALETRRVTTPLGPGETLTAEASRLEGLYPDSTEITLGLNPLPALDLPNVLRRLARYPYGCAEQVTSTSTPLLYTEALAERLGLGGLAPDAAGLAAGLDKLLAYQTPRGGFGTWSAQTEDTPWATAYAMDLLVRARQAGHNVPEGALQRGLGRLAQLAVDPNNSDRALVAAAYAYDVLTLAESVQPAQLRRFHQVRFDRLPTATAKAQVAAALARIGDVVPARQAFEAARAALPSGDYYRHSDYGTILREHAALVAAMGESGVVPGAELLDAAETLATRVADEPHRSTQELAWLVRAAHALADSAGSGIRILRDDTAQTLQAGEAFYATATGSRLADLPRLANASDRPLYGVITVTGVPEGTAPPARNGFTIRRTVYDRFGQPADLSRLAQNDTVVVVLEGKLDRRTRARSLIVDYLPAGLELENANLRGGDTQGLAWLQDLTPTEHVELRDDRFIAARELDASGRSQETRTFRIAYLARAVTPGRFQYAGPYIEAMYQPEYFARGQATEITIR